MARRPRDSSRAPGAFPSRDEILAFVQAAKGKIGAKEIARHFAIKGGDNRIALKTLLAEMTEAGTLTGNRKRLRETGGLPPTTVMEVRGRDADGEVWAVPAVWEADEGAAPKALVTLRSRAAQALPALGPGDRILARLTRLDNGDGDNGYRYEAEPLKQLPREQARLLGIFRAVEGGGGGLILPVNRKEMREYRLESGDAGQARDEPRPET